MMKTNRSKGVSRPSILALLLSALPFASAPAQTASNEGSGYSIIDQGAFYRVWQSAGPVTNAANGQVLQGIQSYTELGDGLCCLANGQWVPAQDVISLTPTGAAAVQGQIEASFSGDITAPGAISLTTASGLVFQSHPLGIYYYDSGSGLVAQIGSVQPCTGLVYAPNVLVFSNVLSGLNADLMLVSAKEGFEQNLVIHQAPPAPASFGLSNATSRLQFWTAMDACPQPVRQQAVRLRTGLVDNRLFYPDCWFPVGSAFVFGNTPLPPPGQAARVRQFDPADPNAIPTAKSLVTVAGQQVLIEEINYTDLAAAFSGLSQAAPPAAGRQAVELAARGQLLPAPAAAKPPSRAIQAASGSYPARGVAIDYLQLTVWSNTFTFTNGATYCVSNSFEVWNTATLQQGTCIKFASNAWMDLAGLVNTPSNGAAAVLTSVDDNGFGQIIANSTGNPNYAGSPALDMDYNDEGNTLVQNLLVRWAQYGIEWEQDPGFDATTTSCAFQNCLTALWAADMYGGTLYLSNNVCCSVSNQVRVQAGATVSGSNNTVSVTMVDTPSQDTGDTNSTTDINKNSHSECSFILANNSQTIVAAWVDSHLGVMQYGQVPFASNQYPRYTWWAVSTNGGSDFGAGTNLPPNPSNATSTWQADAPNLAMGYDPNYPSNSDGTIYLLANAYRDSNWFGFRLWTSTDLGKTFSLLNANVPGGTSGVATVDRPMLKVDPSTHYLYAAGATGGVTTLTVFAARSPNGGTNWDTCRVFEAGQDADIVVAPSGVAYVIWVTSAFMTNANGGNYWATRIRYAWLLPGSNSWSGPADLGVTLNTTNYTFGYRHPLRFNGDSADDWFEVIPFPRSAFANGHVYVVYSDMPAYNPTNNCTNDQGDIFLAEAQTNSTNGLTLSYGPVRVNNDGTCTDQWNPAIAAKPGGTELFIGYYSRQNDPNSNSLIMAYGAKGDVANGLANATFECFPISPTSFPPLFNGTNAVTNMQFDPCYPPGGGLIEFCFDAYARVFCLPSSQRPPCPSTNDVYTAYDSNWFQDDNTWAGADSNYFYYAWCDRSGAWTNNFWWVSGTTNSWPTNYGRPAADVKFAIIQQ